MVGPDDFLVVCLSFPEVTEHPHFHKTAYKVNKKIFATLDAEKKLAAVKLSEIDQDVFSAFDRSIIYPVPNKWGKQGWTNLELSSLRPDMLTDILKTSYREIAPKKLLDKFG